MQARSERLLWEAQGGFRPGRVCVDQIFSEKFLSVKNFLCGLLNLFTDITHPACECLTSDRVLIKVVPCPWLFNLYLDSCLQGVKQS